MSSLSYKIRSGLLFLIVISMSFISLAEEHHEKGENKEFDAAKHAVHHALDAHEFHFTNSNNFVELQ